MKTKRKFIVRLMKISSLAKLLCNVFNVVILIQIIKNNSVTRKSNIIGNYRIQKFTRRNDILYEQCAGNQFYC